MSYRTLGGEPDISSSGAPSPYTPRSDQPFLLSPEYDGAESPGYRSKPVPAAASMIELQPPPVKKSSVVQRGLNTKDYWYVPASMVGVFVLGCFGAFGHHYLYSSLDGAVAHNQLMFVRYGTAIAFFTKASLVGAVVLAYKQRLWVTLRHKTLSIRGLDALFSIVEDPSGFFFSPEIFRKAPLVTLMAITTWLIPLASVLSPGALTTGPTEAIYPGECNVQTLNFTQEADSDWRKPRHGRYGYNLAFFNTTPPPPALSIADWFDEPSFQSDRVTNMALYSDAPVPEKQSPCPGFNCTYKTEFYAPWYNCTEGALQESPFDENDFIPKSRPLPKGKNLIYQYLIDPKDRDYLNPQPNYNREKYIAQGVFTNNPKFWLAYVVDTYKPLPKPPANGRWDNITELHIYRCTPRRAKYIVNSNWRDNRLQHRNATISDSYPTLREQSLGPMDDMKRYKEFVGYYTVGYLARQTLLGNLVKGNKTDMIVTHSEISKTRLVDQDTQWPVADLGPHAFRSFFEDLAMSFISDPYFEIAKTEWVKCRRTRWENRFRYYPRSLLIGYSFAMLAAFLAVVVGCLSIWQNGMCSDTTFSKILVTTRNRTLDRLVKGHPGVALGGSPMPKELEKTELMFGLVDDEGGTAKHTAFGLEEETVTMQRKEVQRTLTIQSKSNVEYGSRGVFFPGAGLGALPG